MTDVPVCSDSFHGEAQPNALHPIHEKPSATANYEHQPKSPTVDGYQSKDATGPGLEPLNVIILGASFGGLSCAHHFLDYTIKQLSITNVRYRLIIIGPSTHIYWNIGAPRALVAPNLIKDEDVFIPIEPGFHRHRGQEFEIIQGSCIEMNATERTVTIDCLSDAAREKCNKIVPAREKRSLAQPLSFPKTQKLPYHALLMCTGTSAHSNLLSLHGSHDKTAESLRAFHKTVAAERAIIIVGGGTSGVEVAGQLATHFNYRSPWAKLRRRIFGGHPSVPDTPKEIYLYTGGDKVLPEFAGPEIGKPKICAKAETMLKKLGVQVVHHTRMIGLEVDSPREAPGTAVVHFDNGAHPTVTRAFVDCRGVQPNSEFAPTSIKDEKGYILTHPHTMRVGGAGERIYAIGDVADYSKNYVVDVYGAVPVVMHNMLNDLLTWEFQAASEFGANEDKIQQLEDVGFVSKKKDSQLCPISRFGGIGVLMGIKLPEVMVHLLKGHDYRVCKAKFVVVDGGNPYAVPVPGVKYK